MPIKDYSLLKCRAVEKRYGPDTNDHYQVRVTDAKRTNYRLAINTKSQTAPSDLLYYVDNDFKHPVLAQLAKVNWGFTPLASKPAGLALDYLRDNLFDVTKMRVLPESAPPPNNGLFQLIDGYIVRAIGEPNAILYAFGQKWVDDPHHPGPQYFKVKINSGLHDIHMNQGNPVGQFMVDNGPWQDGALLIHYPSENRWVALFLAFQSQCFHTDDQTGQCLKSIPGRLVPLELGRKVKPLVKIVGALVNPVEPKGETSVRQVITLLNTASQAIDLRDWHIANRQQSTIKLASRLLAPGECYQLVLAQDPTGFQLNPEGDLITLLDPFGLKVDGVAFSADETQEKGITLVF
jgi:uncharacterized protein YukJ